MHQPFRHLLLLVSLWLGLASAAQAADLITQRAWFEDKAGTLSFDQVKQQEFKPYEGVLSRGIGKGVIWLRLTLDPTVPTTDTLLATDRAVLRVRPVYLDSLTLYDPLGDPNNPKVSGDLTPVSQDDYRSLNLNFVIKKGEAARELYLRVESESTRMVEVAAFTLADVQRQDQTLFIFSGIYLGIAALFLFWAVTTWLMTKDRTIFAFIFSQAAGLGLGLTIFGYARLWFSDTWGGPAISDVLTLSAIGSVTTACWFYMRFVAEFKPPKVVLWLYRICIGFELLALVIFFTGDTRSAITINWAVVLLTPFIGLAGVVLGKGWGDEQEGQRLLPRWMLVLYWFVNLLIILAAGSSGFGLMTQVSAFNVYAALTNGIVAGALAVAFLQYRVNLAQKYRSELQLRLKLSEQNVEKERENREERDRLLAMLGHELKTPLAAMRMLLGNQSPSADTVERIRKAITEMNSVIERSVQSGKIDSDAATLNLQIISPKKELERLIAECREPVAVDLEAQEVGQMTTDYEFFRIIVLNLLDNACKYRAPGSRVQISLKESSRHAKGGGEQKGLEIIVANEPGPAGFPDPEQVFNKYYRSPMAHRQSGSGLGAYLIKGLIHKLGGGVEYAPTAKQVRFVLWHPL